MSELKEISKFFLTKFDYEIRRRSRYYVDAFSDQKRLLKNQKVGVVLDVGANVGQSAEIYRELFSTATIFCFEPTDDAFEVLCDKYKKCDLVKNYKIAVSNVTGRKQFFVNRASVTNSLLCTTEKIDNFIASSWAENVTSLEVETITLDDFFVKAQLDKADILKMDIQGGEFMALKGCDGILKRQAVDLIYTEVLFGDAYSGQGYFHDLSKLLVQYGYILYGLYNLVRASNGSLYQADAIFISPNVEAQLSKHVY